MKTLVIIYLIISCLYLICLILALCDVRRQIKKKFPNYTKSHHSILEKITAIFKIVIIIFCPILHTIMLLVTVLAWDKVVDFAVEQIVNE